MHVDVVLSLFLYLLNIFDVKKGLIEFPPTDVFSSHVYKSHIYHAKSNVI